MPQLRVAALLCVALLATVHLVFAAALFTPNDQTLLPFPIPASLPGTVLLINHDGRPQADVLLLLSLQGCLAKLALHDVTGNSTLLFNYKGGYSQSVDTIYFERARREYEPLGVRFEKTYVNASLQVLLQQHAQLVHSYFLVEEHTDSVNAGISLAGITNNSIVATAAHEPMLKSLGIKLQQDLRGINESVFVQAWLDMKVWPFNAQLISSQSNDKAAVSLSDWSMLLGAIQFSTNDSYVKILQKLRSLSSPPKFLVSFGWYPLNSSEHQYTQDASMHGGGVAASDWLDNGATHIFFHDSKPMVNPTKAGILPDHANKHTVTFLLTDGDNWCSDLNLINDAGHFANPRRGQAPVSFGLNPTLAQVARIGMKSYYESARANDSFTAFSALYAYPEYMDDLAVQQWSAISSAAMLGADMSVLNYLGDTWSERDYAPLLLQKNIQGVFWWPYYNNYVPVNNTGEVRWFNSKPVITNRNALWKDHTTPLSIAQQLNKLSTNHSSTEAYSMIAVHIWSESIDDVLTCIEALDPTRVKVVKPDEFVQLLTRDAHPSSSSFNKNSVDIAGF